jgi:aspartyl-tRNA(Asn)/glutamyl-tRNA(Gln) amidotransferase subunit B
MTAATNGTAADWEMVIGLEVHCELLTVTKLFCGCRNAFGEEPNTNICPVCLGLPGSLPVLNRHAVELAMRIGSALHCEIRPSTFHRKNYFYPDMPKDYQISQYDEPINVEGWLELPDGDRIGVTRAHIEEDTGKTTHVGGGGRIGSADYSLVDYNRAGVPLVEIVSEPDLRSAAGARAYAAELRSILVATGASDGRMEEGSMRVDANVSVRPTGTTEFGTRCEIKNLNSLRSLTRAVEFEAARQISLIEDGRTVSQETRHWDEAAGRTLTMRSKEEAEDYRYFREPDLVPLAPEPSWVEAVALSIGPLPAARRAALLSLLDDASGSQREQVIAVVNQDLDHLVVIATDAGVAPALALTRVANEVAAGYDTARGLDPSSFSALLSLEASGSLSATQAKAVLVEMLAAGGDPVQIASAKGFEGLSTDTLAAAVAEVVAANPTEWGRLVDGDHKLYQFFTGQVMRITKGQANGEAVRSELDRLKG